jgi:hypothetical protein
MFFLVKFFRLSLDQYDSPQLVTIRLYSAQGYHGSQYVGFESTSTTTLIMVVPAGTE